MLEENNKRDTDSEGRTVFVPHLGQTGVVLEKVGSGRLRVRLSTGSTVVLEDSQVQDRQLLMG